jgi:hypothetical protein
MGACGQDSSALGQDLMVGSCEHSSERLSSIIISRPSEWDGLVRRTGLLELQII